MFTKSKFSIVNQAIDLFLKTPEDENLVRLLKNSFRKTLFESEAFLLDETKEKTVGIYVANEGAGATLLQDDEELRMNLGFQKMGLADIEEMVSILNPLEGVLANFKGDLGVMLIYHLENHEEASEAGNAFLREIILKPPVSLVDDAISRTFKIRRFQDGLVFTFASVNRDLLSLDKGVALLQDERARAENVFLVSLHSWLNSIKSPELVSCMDAKGMNCSNHLARNHSSH